MGFIFCIVDIMTVHCSGDPPGIAAAAGAVVVVCGASTAGWCGSVCAKAAPDRVANAASAMNRR
ncbi:hypothetical protein NKH60_03020 [Mesorhizobium sp. M1006]|uniref:hypothetical protein n=1 Tax=Mesorhizobium sp. M1006 TaxID=2957048 RepID=UPI00333C7B1A